MSLLFMDGFDYYKANGASQGVTPFNRKWGTITTSATFEDGRHNDTFSGNLSYNATSGRFMTPPLGDEATLIVGFALFFTTTSSLSREIFNFDYSGTKQCSLHTDGNQQLVLRNGQTGTIQASGTTPIRGSIWYYIEIKVTINNTTGSVHLKLNEQDEIHTAGGPVTNLDTQTASSALVNKLDFAGNLFSIDDLYILNTTTTSPGPANDDFLGETMIETLFADGVGNSSAWTPLAGSNFSNIDEQATDDDTTYVSTSTAANVDTYTFDNLAQIDLGIKSVAVNIQHRKTSQGSKTIRSIVRHSGSDNAGTTVPVFDSYSIQTDLHEVNPGTNTTWTTGDVDAAEFGAELVS